MEDRGQDVAWLKQSTWWASLWGWVITESLLHLFFNPPSAPTTHEDGMMDSSADFSTAGEKASGLTLAICEGKVKSQQEQSPPCLTRSLTYRQNEGKISSCDLSRQQKDELPPPTSAATLGEPERPWERMAPTTE